jgi:predicted transcriptional regulator
MVSDVSEDPRPQQAAPQLHELEREIMEELWARDSATVREIHDALNARSGTVRAYTTVMTVMSRLAAKGVVSRRRQGRSDVYAAGMTREAWVRARAAADVDELLEDFGDVALAHFARHLDGLDPERREALRRLVEGNG